MGLLDFSKGLVQNCLKKIFKEKSDLIFFPHAFTLFVTIIMVKI